MNIYFKNVVLGFALVVMILIASSVQCEGAENKMVSAEVLSRAIYATSDVIHVEVPPYAKTLLYWRDMTISAQVLEGVFYCHGEYRKKNGKWKRFNSKQLDETTIRTIMERCK